MCFPQFPGTFRISFFHWSATYLNHLFQVLIKCTLTPFRAGSNFASYVRGGLPGPPLPLWPVKVPESKIVNVSYSYIIYDLPKKISRKFVEKSPSTSNFSEPTTCTQLSKDSWIRFNKTWGGFNKMACIRKLFDVETWKFAWSRENDLSKDHISNIFSFKITEVG